MEPELQGHIVRVHPLPSYSLTNSFYKVYGDFYSVYLPKAALKQAHANIQNQKESGRQDIFEK
jgi:hypothetical protein